VDGQQTAFELACWGHWAYTNGHSIGDPPPPKLEAAIRLWEAETRAREALKLQAADEKRKKAEAQARRDQRTGKPGTRVVARG
jgi:hypothetical protein